MATSRLPNSGLRQFLLRHTTRGRCLCWSASAVFAFVACGPSCAQSAVASLPDAPAPQPEYVAANSTFPPAAASSSSALPPALLLAGQQTFPPSEPPYRGKSYEGLPPGWIPVPRRCSTSSCSSATPRRSCCQTYPHAFHDYLQRYGYHIYTRHELAMLAVHSVADPFNLLTVAGTSAYSVAIDSHSPYGPGFNGIAKLSGVTLSQEATSEFFGTFLIPSIDHQDPHYHRMPGVALPRRIAHCIYQIFWTDSDSGTGMVNYASIVGGIADEAVGAAYVPYQRTSWGASTERIAIGWGTDPIGNFIAEFAPDVANHINVRIVFLQRVINRVAIEEGGTAP